MTHEQYCKIRDSLKAEIASRLYCFHIHDGETECTAKLENGLLTITVHDRDEPTTWLVNLIW